MEDADSLRQAVQLSLSAQTARREALADFLTPAVQPQGIERTDFAERWQGSKLAKAFMATTSQVLYLSWDGPPLPGLNEGQPSCFSILPELVVKTERPQNIDYK